MALERAVDELYEEQRNESLAQLRREETTQNEIRYKQAENEFMKWQRTHLEAIPEIPLYEDQTFNEDPHLESNRSQDRAVEMAPIRQPEP